MFQPSPSLRLPVRAFACAAAAALLTLLLVLSGQLAPAMAADSAEETASISGRLTFGFEAGPAVDYAYIDVYPADDPQGARVAGGFITYGDEGMYTVDGIPPGSYIVEFRVRELDSHYDDGYYHAMSWKDAVSREDADPITVEAGDRLTGYDTVFRRAGSISGTVLAPDGSPMVDMYVTVRGAESAYYGTGLDFAGGHAYTDESGHYTVRGLRPGYYHLGFYAPEGSPYEDQWWRYDDNWYDSDLVRVGDREAVTGKDAVLGDAEPAGTWGAVSRIAGADRYATAVSVSRSAFGPGVPVVYITNGRKFPDALSAAPLAATTAGPVLLTEADRIPRIVAEELQRLAPGRIVVLGDSASVSDQVLPALAEFSGGGVSRIAGSSRYATSAAISRAGWEEPGVAVAYLVNGEKFPDALSVGPIAGIADGPVLLTEKDRLPAAIRKELARLQPERIIMLGGDSSISGLIEDEIGSYAARDWAERWYGNDRFTTAAFAVGQEFQRGVQTVYVTNGEKFPDALAFGPVGGITGSPLLLTRKGVLPAATIQRLELSRPQRIVILGDENSVSTAVEEQLATLGAQG